MAGGIFRARHFYTRRTATRPGKFARAQAEIFRARIPFEVSPETKLPIRVFPQAKFLLKSFF
jgi:hypothetical protein